MRILTIPIIFATALCAGAATAGSASASSSRIGATHAVGPWPARSAHGNGDRPLYVVRNLGSLGGTSCCLVVTNNSRGWVDGTSNLHGDKNFHPFLWIDGVMRDLGTLGGPNASAGGMNDRGDVTVGGSDTGKLDPLGEDFCGFGTHQICRSFLWNDGRRTLIPTLGGNNNDINTVNNSRLVLVFAETNVHDPTCVAPQVLGFEAFTWEPESREIHRLPPLTGDSVSIAFDMNDRGEAAGYSGACGTGAGPLTAYHAALWRLGKPIQLDSLGGTFFNGAFGINRRGQVAGVSGLRGDTTAHAVVWQNGTVTDLGTLPGDTFSVGNGINDAGQVALQSCKSASSSKCRAAVWQDGVMTDLNSVIRRGSSFYLISANSINARGALVGTALDRHTGALVPFLATPCREENVRVEGCQGRVQGATDALEPATIPPVNVREHLWTH